MRLGHHPRHRRSQHPAIELTDLIALLGRGNHSSRRGKGAVGLAYPEEHLIIGQQPVGKRLLRAGPAKRDNRHE